MTPEFKALNGLRFPACVMIFLQHVPEWALPAGFGAAPLLGGQWHAAMPYFFILSGFVLAHAYGDAIARPDGTLDNGGIRRFLLRRAIRLYPLHWLGLALILPWAFMAGKVDYSALLAHLTLTQALIPDHAIYYAFNEPSWSLSVEVVFALAFPLLILAFARLGPSFKLVLLLAAVLAAAIAAIVLAQLGRTAVLILYINPFARLLEFAAGMLLYMLWQRYRWQLNGLVWEILCVGLMAASMILTVDLPYPYRLVAPFVPPALLLTMVFAGGTGPLRRALSTPLALRLGRLAFAFYVLHFIVIRYVELTPLAQLAPNDGTRWVLVPLLFMPSFLGAIAIHRGFEVKAERWLRARFTSARLAAS